MPDYRPYNDDPRYNRAARSSSSAQPQPGIRREGAQRRPAGSHPSASRPSGARPSGSRLSDSAGSRPSGNRTAPRQGQRSSGTGSRSSQGHRGQQGRRRRRRGVQPRFFVILGVLVVLIVALILIFGGDKDKSIEPQTLPTAQPAGNGLTNVTVSSNTPDPNAPQPAQTYDPAAQGGMVEEEEDNDEDIPEISSADQVQVSPEQLMINNSLPSEWLNVLLLGTDERTLTEPARTDTMIIASINTKTGEVKLTSLLRDVAVKFDDLPKYNTTYYRLNAANYFGGPLYAVKTVNQLLEMNIQYYVSVNFFGFTKIAQALGGIEVDITEAEMNEINKKQHNQARLAATIGLDESDQENVNLTTYGPNTHLNGRQTLAYARVRYADNDFVRTERQRIVITKLTEKLRGKNVAEIGMLLTSLAGNVSTNMDLNSVLQVAMTVLSSDISNIETLRLPENGTYTLDRRNDQEMFYDTDWDRNAMLLYNFIYA